MSTELVKVQESVSAMEKIETGLAQMRDRFVGRIYDVSTAPGMALAKADRAEVRESRFEVERARKAGKAPLLALGKWADQTAARITAEILKIETPIDAVVKAEEDRIEAEKQARIEAEIARVAEIQRRLDGIRNWPVNAANQPSMLVGQMLAQADAYVIEREVFEEFSDTASEVLVASRAALAGLLSERKAHEAAQEQLKRDQEDLARLRAEQAARDRLAREAQAKADAEAKVERDRLEAIAKTERDAEAARQAEVNRVAREAIEREAAENRRIAAERRTELDRQETAARQEREAETRRQAAAAAELAAREEALRISQLPKAKKPKHNPGSEALIDVIAKHYGVEASTAGRWMREIDWEAIAA